MSETAARPQANHGPTDARTDRFYFPALDGLRFVAFFLVYLFHGGIPQGQLSSLVGRTAALALREHGWVGVQLFFTLSGYLITTLLLREERAFGHIDLRAFWVRRILRIWPLYYLIVALGFFGIPALSGQWGTSQHRAMLATHLPAFLVFLGNWTMSIISPIPSDVLSVLWSVCVEEQFYVLVPLFVAWVRPRYRLGVVAALMTAAVLARGLAARWGASDIAIRFNTLLCLDTLLSGVALALVFGPDPAWSPRARRAGWLAWALVPATAWLFTRPKLAYGSFEHRTWDVVAIWVWGAALVAAVVGSRRCPRGPLAYSRVVWLGKISYGLYMYHEVALWLKTGLEGRMRWFPNKEILLTIGAFAATVVFAAVSYYGYERRFLALKRGWTRVPSRPV